MDTQKINQMKQALIKQGVQPFKLEGLNEEQLRKMCDEKLYQSLTGNLNWGTTDGFSKQYKYNIAYTLPNGEKIKVAKIAVSTLPSGRKVEIFIDIAGNQYFQYRAADNTVLKEDYFKKQEKMFFGQSFKFVDKKLYKTDFMGNLSTVIDNKEEKPAFLNLPNTNSEKKSKPLHNVSQNVIDNIGNLSYITTNLDNLQRVVDNDIDSNNVTDFLKKYEEKYGKSIIEGICDCKFVNNNQRKNIIINIIDKLESACNNNGQEVSDLVSILKKNIDAEYNKTGFINTDSINAIIEALIDFSARKKTNITQKDPKIIEEEFNLPKNIKYKKTEKIIKYPSGNKIYGKNITYILKNGTKLVEVYSYNDENKQYALESKSIYDDSDKIQKSAYFYETIPPKLNNVHYYENEQQVETHYFRENGTEYISTESRNGNYKSVTFGKNGIAAIEKNIKNANANDSTRVESTTMYNSEGYELQELESNKALHSKYMLKDYFKMDKDQLDSFFKSPLIQYNTLQLNTERKFGKKVSSNILEYLFIQTKNLAKERNIDISDLITNFEKYLREEDLERASSILKQAMARATRFYSLTEDIEYRNNLEDMRGTFGDFKQGHFGSCWLVSAVKSLSMTQEGEQLLQQVVKTVSQTGEYEVTLAGTPVGKKVYRFTKEQLEQASELSTGETRMRAIECAFRDLFLELDKKKLKHSNDITGGSLETAVKYMAGDNIDIEYYRFLRKNKNKKAVINELQKMGTISALCGFSEGFNSTYIDKKTGHFSSNKIRTRHAYTLEKIDDKFAYIINPWDTAKTIKIPIEDFEKYCVHISLIKFKH